MQEYLIVTPAAGFGAILIWAIIFLETYRHFPMMEKRERIWLSINSATITALTFIIIVLIFMVAIIWWVL